MQKFYFTILWCISLLAFHVESQPWVQNDAIFNPSGVPSLPFSQPRFADLDDDGDLDLILGSIDENPLFLENAGTIASPVFTPGPDIFSTVESLDAEMAVCVDIDNDLDLDLITGGFTGLNLYLNIGDPENPVFEKEDGFFMGLSVGQIPVPDFTDLDNDGDPDLVVGLSENGLVKVYTNIGSAANAEFSEDNVYEIGDVGLYAYPQFADLDDDNDFDLLVGRDAYGFIYYENTGDAGNAVWEENNEVFEELGNETYWNSPGLADLNGDEKFDLVFGTASGPLFYYVNVGTGSTPAWQQNTALFGGVIDVGGASNPCFFDFDHDGDLDLITGTQLGDIKYYQNTGSPTGPGWEENSTYFETLTHSIYSAVAIGDVNNDSLPDAVVGDLSGNLFYHRNTGSGFVYESEYLQSVSLGGWSSPFLIDLDDDGDLDIVAGNEAGNLAYIQNDGTAEEPDWTEVSGFFGSIDVGMNCVPTLGDVDFDGDPDLLCGNISGNLKYYENQDGNWFLNSETFMGVSGGQNTSPAFGDLDGDGDVDLTLGQYSGIFNYFENQNPTTGTAEENGIINAGIRIYPNPAKDFISVEFDPGSGSDVELQVLDLSGKVEMKTVFSLGNGHQKSKLDVRKLPSGIYFMQLNTKQFSVTKKMVKL